MFRFLKSLLAVLHVRHSYKNPRDVQSPRISFQSEQTPLVNTAWLQRPTCNRANTMFHVSVTNRWPSNCRWVTVCRHGSRWQPVPPCSVTFLSIIRCRSSMRGISRNWVVAANLHLIHSEGVNGWFSLPLLLHCVLGFDQLVIEPPSVCCWCLRASFFYLMARHRF